MPSTVIAAIRYDKATQTLEIAFRGKRGCYRYFDVPAEEYEAFRKAPSKGTYLNHVFKEKEYRYEKTSDS